MELHRFPDRSALVEALADEIAARLADGVAARGAASLVVPGGSTPAPLFDALCERDLPWKAVVITLNDERWVDPSDAASNERLVRERLLVGRAAEACFFGLKTPAATPRQAVVEVEARLADVARPFDVMVLGMGEDGHTASLFPYSAALAASLGGDPAQVQAVEAPHARGAIERMTLSLPAIVDSRSVAVLITGSEKLAVLGRAAEPGDPLALPIRAVLSRAPVHAYWSP